MQGIFHRSFFYVGFNEVRSRFSPNFFVIFNQLMVEIFMLAHYCACCGYGAQSKRGLTMDFTGNFCDFCEAFIKVILGYCFKSVRSLCRHFSIDFLALRIVEIYVLYRFL